MTQDTKDSKPKMHSPDLTQENIAKLAELFPNCITESRDEKGQLKQTIDFDQLRQELLDHIVEGPQERYQLNWPGKKEALLAANAPIAKTLRPCREESVNFDTTKNLFIEGDNLEALKLLQETYLNKVKMIYIDPPYNTGNNFIYNDYYGDNFDDYLQKSNQENEQGQRLVANLESNGRFHSNWLTFMYPRLRIAKNMLKEDGVIFISIDDNELSNLKKICDEIFGEKNFVAQLIWKRRASSAMADNNVSSDHDYVICYQKGKLGGFFGQEKDFSNYSNPDNDPRGPWVTGDLTVGMTASMRPNQAYDLVDPVSGKTYPYNPNRVWAYVPESMEKLINEERIIFPNDQSRRPMLKRFKNELKSTHNPFSTLMLNGIGLNTEATREIQQLFNGNIFEYSKPTSLIKTLINQLCYDNELILDFFAGSCTTAHAIYDINKNQTKNIQFIMVQYPEDCGENTEARRAGYKNIAEIGKERMRRAIKKLSNDQPVIFDHGFRVFKVDSSNMKDVYYTPDQVAQKDLFGLVGNIKKDRTDEDLLSQVLLDWGVDLTLPIHSESIFGKKVYFVDQDALTACFEPNLDEEFIKKLAERNPLRVVFRDSSYGRDSTKINAEQIFKLISPNTDVKTI